MEDIFRRLCWTQIRISRMHHRIIDGRIQRLGIHPGQHIVLMHLKRMGKMASQVQIAEHLDVSPACVARTLKALESGGYITRSDCRSDSRRNEINITEKGEAIVQQSRIEMDSLDRAAFRDFSETELQSLQELLGRVLNNLSDVEKAERGNNEEMSKI